MKLRGSTRTKVALLTTLVFMLTLVFSMPSLEAAALTPSAPKHIDTQASYSFAIQTDGTLWAWGNDMSKGKLGIDPSQMSAEEIKYSRVCSPKQVEWAGRQGKKVKYVAAGDSHSAVILENGECWLWGHNTKGQLGDGTTATPRITPTVPLAGITDMAAFAFSGLSTVSLKNDGTVWAWGSNTFGLGTGSTEQNILEPAQVKGPGGEGYLDNVKAIANYNAILALKEDGAVWGWGSNRWGQLGDDPSTTSTIPYPVQIEGLSDVSAISVAPTHCLARKKDGTVWSWGNGQFGQLGRDVEKPYISYTPSRVEGLDDVVAIDSGMSFSLVLKKDGTVWGWGKNSNGLLPDETAQQTATPTQISGLSNIIEIAAGMNHYLALERDGTLWGWGYNDKGQLGTGEALSTDAPISPVVKSLMKLEPPLEAPMVVFLYPYASPSGPTGGIEVDRPLLVGFVNPLSEAGVAKISEVALNKIDAEGNKESVEFTYTLSQDKLLTIQPAKNLEYGTDYELLIPAGIEDTVGNSADNESTLLFKTLSFEQPSYKITQGEQGVETVKPGEKYRITAAVTNASVKAETVKAILQLRGGKGARQEQGGNVLAQNSQIITVDSEQSSDVILDFEVPADIDSPMIYGDIFVWEDDCLNARAKPAHFSCPVVE